MTLTKVSDSNFRHPKRHGRELFTGSTALDDLDVVLAILPVENFGIERDRAPMFRGYFLAGSTGGPTISEASIGVIETLHRHLARTRVPLLRLDISADPRLTQPRSVTEGHTAGAADLDSTAGQRKSVDPQTQPFVQIASDLESVFGLPDNWDAYGAPEPSQLARDMATSVLHGLSRYEIPPDRVVPVAEGGVAFVFLVSKGYMDIEVTNEGDVLIGVNVEDREPTVRTTTAAEAAGVLATLFADEL